MRELELTERWGAGWHQTPAFWTRTDKSQKQLRLSCCFARETCTPEWGWGWRGGGGHFPPSDGQTINFWLAAGLTPPVHHWALSIPQHLEAAHKSRGPHPPPISPVVWTVQLSILWTGRVAPPRRQTAPFSLTLICLLAKSHRNKWLGTLCNRLDAECWQAPSSSFAVSFFFFLLHFFCLSTSTWLRSFRPPLFFIHTHIGKYGDVQPAADHRKWWNF